MLRCRGTSRSFLAHTLASLTVLGVAALLAGVDGARALAMPPPPCVTILGLSPPVTDAIGGEWIVVHGYGMLSVGQVYVDNVPLPGGMWVASSDNYLGFEAPPAHHLGPVPVRLVCFFGEDTDFLIYNPSDPPIFLAPSTFTNGSDLNLRWGGLPAQMVFFAVNFTGKSFPYGSSSVLDSQILVGLPQTDPVTGLGNLTIPKLGGLPVGLDIYYQILTIKPPGTDLGTIRVSNIEHTKVSA